jgi:hypothetical protein
MTRHSSCSSTLVALGLSLPAALLGAPAHAQDRAEPDAGVQALGSHQQHLRVDLGARTQYVSSAGLDPFSENDAIPQFSMGASYAFWSRDKLSVAGVFGFDYSGWTSRARSADTSLDLKRLSLGPEARYHVLRVLVVTAKLAPTLTRQSATLSSGVGSELTKVAWKGGFDATAGVAFEVFGYHSGKSRLPRLWLTGEGGYGWTASNDLVLRPDDADDAPERFQPLDLEDLSLSGPLFKITAAVSFW